MLIILEADSVPSWKTVICACPGSAVTLAEQRRVRAAGVDGERVRAARATPWPSPPADGGTSSALNQERLRSSRGITLKSSRISKVWPSLVFLRLGVAKRSVCSGCPVLETSRGCPGQRTPSSWPQGSMAMFGSRDPYPLVLACPWSRLSSLAAPQSPHLQNGDKSLSRRVTSED